MPNGALFVSFAESDGGHSYLAARAMLEPSQVGHLLFRNTVSEALDALIGGQSNFAVVPFYNSITQWEGATVKALATGQFEIFAETCMATSYVLAAHREHINIALSLYANERGIQPGSLPDFTNLDDWISGRVKHFRTVGTPSEDDCRKYEEREWENAKDALKTYTRLLTTIYVGAQADEQYRGRLLRPDMSKVDIDLTRNPLRVLEEVNRADLMKSITRGGSFPAGGGFGGFGGGGAGGAAGINIGFAPSSTLLDFKGPAALVAKGLMDPPGNQEGWDKPGSLGEIVALLRKLQVLLDVYSFGPPDLPDNKTQYLLLGRKGEKIRPDFTNLPLAKSAPLRTMALIRGNSKAHGKEIWLKPREELHRRVERTLHVVYDRPPLMVSPPGRTVFLQEGGVVKGLFNSHESIKDLGEKLKKSIERKPPESGWGSANASRLDSSFLGIYPTWSADDACKGWVCDPAGTRPEAAPPPILVWLLKNLPLILLLLVLLGGLYYSYLTWRDGCVDSNSFWCTGDVDWQKVFPPAPPPPAQPPPPEPTAPPSTDASAAPPATYPAPAPTTTDDSEDDEDEPETPATTPPPPAAAVTPPVAGPPPYAPPPETTKLVAFYEGKANLTAPALSILRDSAMRAMETDRLVRLRLDALGPREEDADLWRRRLQAVKDELVRLGVPSDRIFPAGSGPFEVTIRQRAVPQTRTQRERVTMELIPDPLAGDSD